MLRVANVAMKGGSPPRVTSRPFIMPITEPNPSIRSTTTHQEHPADSNTAERTPTTARVEPTERSMPPEVMTSVIATATIRVGAAWRNTLRTLPVVRNVGLLTLMMTTSVNRTRAKPSWKGACWCASQVRQKAMRDPMEDWGGAVIMQCPS